MGAIIVSGLGKAYKQYQGRWSRLAEWLLPGAKPRYALKWVLQDVNFAIQPGEAVGIVGVNGAGKSTLLKLITGTIQPTAGTIDTSGRVAALLELGMGFHPDFTGRQNAAMAGQLQGLSVSEVRDLMPDIENFADIGDYIDQPLRVYSSGMQARLAFSVATCVRPDILIVDEALSVGDMAFQAKCMQRMRTLLDSGTTILFVSHALNQIRQFCSKALYIADGRLKAFGAANSVCDQYQNDLVGGGHATASGFVPAVEGQSPQLFIARDPSLRKNSVGGGAGGTLDLEFMNFGIFNSAGAKIEKCRPKEELAFRAVIRANSHVPEGAAVGLLIADKSGYHLMACNTNYYDKFLPAARDGDAFAVEWKFLMPFALGEFRIDIGIKPEPFSNVFYDRVFCARTLSVVPDVGLLRKNFGGYLYVEAHVDIRRVSSRQLGS